MSDTHVNSSLTFVPEHEGHSQQSIFTAGTTFDLRS